MKRFSIIIATYNASNTLQECLDSIRFQKGEDVELLIIDGESTDTTLKIIETNADIIDCLIHEKDKGIYDAWNKGILASHGEWILFLGADDILCPYTIHKYTEYISSMGSTTSVDYISGRVNYIDCSGHKFCEIGEAWDWNVFSKKMSVAHVASLHKRILFDELGLFSLKYKICGDYEFLIRKKRQLKAAFINEVVANMRMGGISLSRKAIDETCLISNIYTPRPFFSRFSMYISKCISFYLFLVRIKIWRFVKNADIHVL